MTTDLLVFSRIKDKDLNLLPAFLPSLVMGSLARNLTRLLGPPSPCGAIYEIERMGVRGDCMANCSSLIPVKKIFAGRKTTSLHPWLSCFFSLSLPPSSLVRQLLGAACVSREARYLKLFIQVMTVFSQLATAPPPPTTSLGVVANTRIQGSTNWPSNCSAETKWAEIQSTPNFLFVAAGYGAQPRRLEYKASAGKGWDWLDRAGSRRRRLPGPSWSLDLLENQIRHQGLLHWR